MSKLKKHGIIDKMVGLKKARHQESKEMKEHLDKITPWLKKCKNITAETNYEIKTIKAIDLLTPARIDIVAKIKFLEHMGEENECDFAKKLYKAHLTAFSGGGRCSEPGDSTKNNFNDYVRSFEQTAKSVHDGGFNPSLSLVPVAKNGIIMDGSHRVASAICSNSSVECIVFNDIDEPGYNYSFFSKNMLGEEYLDYMVLEYCKIKKNTYVFCIWPKADKSKRQKAYDLLKKTTDVIYEKDIDLSYLGYRNFIIQVYRNFNSWIGGPENRYKGANSALDSRYIPGVPLKIFVVESDRPREILELKKRLRDLFSIGNFSVHSTDNQQETVYMLSLLLNKNSLDLLNNGKPDNFEKLDHTIDSIKKKIDDRHLSPDNFMIIGSSTMGLYGLRCPDDVDFVAKGQEYDFLEEVRPGKSKYFSCQNHFSDDFSDGRDLDTHNRFGMTLNNLLFDPKNYLFYNGIKFASLETVAAYKTRRGGANDLKDVKAISNFRKNNCNSLNNYLKNAKTTLKIYTGKAKLLAMYGLKKMHVGKIYHLVKGDRRRKKSHE